MIPSLPMPLASAPGLLLAPALVLWAALACVGTDGRSASAGAQLGRGAGATGSAAMKMRVVRNEKAVEAGATASVTLAELIRGLVETVAISSDLPLEIARRFGEVETDSAGGVYVRPRDPRLKKVIVVKRPGTGELNDVELQLAVPGSVTVAELEALWGPPQHPPALAIETRTVIFRPPLGEGARFRASVTLTLDGDETGPATWVKVIREPR